MLKKPNKLIMIGQEVPSKNNKACLEKKLEFLIEYFNKNIIPIKNKLYV